MPSPTRPHDRRESLCAFVFYVLVAIALLDRGLLGRGSQYFIGGSTDLGTYVWFFKWWPYALTHGRNPFLTDLLWAPLGVNLAWVTSIPLPTFASLPIQLTLGEAAAYDSLCTIAPPLAAFVAYLLCRRVTGAFWPSLAGGYLFGFSSYMLAEVLSHLVLIAIFPVPLAALLALKRLDGEITARSFAVTLAIVLAAQFLCSVELFATLTLVGGFALLLAIVLFSGEMRARLVQLIAPTAAAYVLASAILSPYLYYMLALGTPHGPIWTPDRFSADVIGFLVPTEIFALGTLRSALAITREFAVNLPEDGAYIGIPMLVLVELYRRQHWTSPQGKFLTIMLAAIAVAAMGPALHIAGRSSIAMPWALFTRLPLIANILPVRFMMYAFLVLGLMLATWLASSSVSATAKYVATALVAVSLIPNPSAAFWVSELRVPEFFSSGAYRNELSSGETILALPFGKQGTSMYWQAKSDMYFKMAGGWTGVTPFPFARMPIVNFFEGADDLPEPDDQLKTYLAQFGVTSIVADPADTRFAVFKPVLDALKVPARLVGDVWIYKIPADELARYAKVPPAAAEARAEALRMDAVLTAAAQYIAGGHDAPSLTPRELQRYGLLPAGWHVRAARYAVSDWSVGTLPDGRIAIALNGSYDGLKPLIERYSSGAEILYPAPARWNPRAVPPKDVLRAMLLIFSR
ncbi:MAG TPA: hypothetical protein VEU51_13135, partial [Candidatus Acidoferrales bacterium]|nr:hypothetical protein [Candidatus Acidoferrales bacterium]